MKENLLFVTERNPVVFTSGKGSYLYDDQGNEYLDFISGWAVCALGHCHPTITEAIKRESEKLLNCSPAFYNSNILELAEYLTSHSCMDKVWFGNSGAEVNEAAVKLARKWGKLHKKGAYEIITTKNSFHGRTLTMMSATGKDAWKEMFEPKTSGFVHSVFNDITSVKALINENSVAIMLEPVQGEGGVNVATVEYLTQLKELCVQHNLLLIFDEVQTGIGRLGSLFGYEQFGVEPDIMTLGKGLGGGLPVSAILCKEELDIFSVGEHGGTFGGNPFTCGVVLEIIKYVNAQTFLSHVTECESYIKTILTEHAEEYGIINIRGKGLLLGFDVKDILGKVIVDKALAKGLILNAPQTHTIRLVPALNVSRDEIDAMFEILFEVLGELKI